MHATFLEGLEALDLQLRQAGQRWSGRNLPPPAAGEERRTLRGAALPDTVLLLAFRDRVQAHHPETKALPVVAGVLLLTGTLFYWRFEDWTVIEALYFAVVALTTVGFGDFAPTTPGTQIFTIIYILTGLGILVALLSAVAQQYLRQKDEDASVSDRLKARRQHRRGGEEDAPG